MDINSINEKIENLGHAWESYKQVNDERLIELENKGFIDPLTQEKLNKIDKEIDKQQDQLNKLQTALMRPVNGNEVVVEDREYKSAFDNYIKRGIETGLSSLEVKRDLTTALDSSYGGYLLTPNIQRLIMDNIQERCVMRKICSIQEISTSAFDVIDATGMTPSWINETGTINDTDTSIFSKNTINTFDLVAQPKVSQKMLDDSAIDIEQWLGYRLSEDFADAEEDTFINGDGTNKPKGILSYEEIGKITSVSSENHFDEDDILELYYSLKDKYINNASFLMPRSAMKNIRQLKDKTSGHYLWNPALLSGQEDTLLGAPIYCSSHMPVIDNASKSIIFGDFKYYQIVDRIGIRILRDPYTAKPFIRFYTTKRVGGAVVDTNAFKILVSATI